MLGIINDFVRGSLLLKTVSGRDLLSGTSLTKKPRIPPDPNSPFGPLSCTVRMRS